MSLLCILYILTSRAVSGGELVFPSVLLGFIADSSSETHAKPRYQRQGRALLHNSRFHRDLNLRLSSPCPSLMPVERNSSRQPAGVQPGALTGLASLASLSDSNMFFRDRVDCNNTIWIPIICPEDLNSPE